MKTKNRIWFCSFTIIGLILIFTYNCKKAEDSYIKITDADGNVYTTVTIGTQVWMVENLKTTRYRNGDLIGTTSPATLDISAEAAPKYQWAYEGNESNLNTYGRLYTWYAVTDARNVCPTGWHLPSDVEWTTLTDYLITNGHCYGGSGDDIAKSIASTSGWTADPKAGNVGNHQASNNSSGFTALPSGLRIFDGSYLWIGLGGYWWSSTEYSATNVYNRFMVCNGSNVGCYDIPKHYGFSVRCLQDD